MKGIALLASFVSGLVLVSTASADQLSNLWPNPSFEEGTMPELPGWEPSPGSCETAFDSGSFHHGARSVRISGRTGDTPFLSRAIPLDAASTYHFSCWVRRAADASIGLLQCDGAGRLIADAHRLSCQPLLRNEVRYWVQQSCIVTRADLHPQTRSVRACAFLSNTTLWLDDMVLVKLRQHELPPVLAAYDDRTWRFYRDRQVLLHVSFDRGHDVLDADYAAGDPGVVARDRPPLAGLDLKPGVSGLAAHFSTSAATLSYAGPGNVRHDQGTIAFWICGNWNRLDRDPFTERRIVTISANEGYQTQLREILELRGGRPREPLRCTVMGFDWQERGAPDTAQATAPSAVSWRPGEWRHVALTWTRARGLTAFVDGKPQPGRGQATVRPGAIVPNLITLGRRNSGVAPDMLLDEFTVFSQPLTPDQVGVLADPKRGLHGLPPLAPEPEPDLDAVRAAKVREYGLAELDGLPQIEPAGGSETGAVVRVVPIARATDRWNSFRFTNAAADNKRHTRTFTREPKQEIYLDLRRPEPINALMVMGDIQELSVHAGDHPTDPVVCAANNAVFLRWTGQPFEASRVLLRKSKDTSLNEAVLFHIVPRAAITTPAESRTLCLTPIDAADDGRSCLEHIDRYCPDRDRMALNLRDGAGGGADVALAPMQALHLVTPPLRGDLGLTAFELQLDLRSAAKRTAVSVRLRDPLCPARTIVDADLCLNGSEHARYRLLLDHPDTLVAAGRRLWWEFAFRDGVTIAAGAANGSRLVLHQGQPDRVKEEFVPALLDRALGRYSADSESHQWDYDTPDNGDDSFRELFDCTAELLRWAPSHTVGQALWWRIRSVPPVIQVADLLPGDARAPDWARLQTAVLEQTRHVIHAWCDRQAADGRFSDNFGDDAELPAQWPYYPLITGDEKSVVALEKSADAYWHHPRITNGYISDPQDAIHSAEYTPVAECPLLLTRYGDPVHLERLMTIAANMPRWMGRSRTGHLHFRSSWVSADGQIDTSNQRNFDEAACARIAAPTWCVAYYNNNPTARQIIVDWSRAWVEDFLAERDGKPANVFPSRIFFPEDRFEGPHFGSGARWMAAILYEAYLLTGDRFFLRDYGRKGSPERWAKLTGAWTARDQHLAYVRTLMESLQRISWEKHLYIHADPSTDRVYLPSAMLDTMALGGVGPSSERDLVGHIAASYEGTGLDVAPLVLQDTGEHLLVAFWNFASRPKDIGVRVWSLRPGEYELTVGPDDNRDDRIDRPTATERIPIRRFTRVPLRLPPKKLTLLELRLAKADEVAELLPDPAVSPRTTAYDPADKTLRVTVHNVGSAEARDVKVVVEGPDGRSMAAETVERIAAPLDLKPRREIVAFSLPRKPARVRIDFADPEITDVNNVVALD